MVSSSLCEVACLVGIGVMGLTTDGVEITETSSPRGVEATDTFCDRLTAFLADLSCGLVSSQPAILNLSHLEQGAVPMWTHLTLAFLSSTNKSKLYSSKCFLEVILPALLAR